MIVTERAAGCQGGYPYAELIQPLIELGDSPGDVRCRERDAPIVTVIGLVSRAMPESADRREPRASITEAGSKQRNELARTLVSLLEQPKDRDVVLVLATNVAMRWMFEQKNAGAKVCALSVATSLRSSSAACIDDHRKIHWTSAQSRHLALI